MDGRGDAIVLKSSTNVVFGVYALFHEGLHKLLNELNILKEHFTKTDGEGPFIDEEMLTHDITRLLFDDDAFLDALTDVKTVIPEATDLIFSACKVFGLCNRLPLGVERGCYMPSPAVPPVGGLEPVAVPVSAEEDQSSETLKLDFNNDGISDFIEVHSINFEWLELSGEVTDYRAEPSFWRYAVPHLNGQYPREGFWLIPFNDCEIPEVTRDNEKLESVTAWRVGKNNIFGEWDMPVMRFFNLDRTMFFRAGQKVALRSNPQEQLLLKTPLVLFYPKEGRQIEPVYGVLDGCYVVPLDELIWITKSGTPLDMRKAVSLAQQEGPIPNSLPDTIERQVAQLIRDAMHDLAINHPDATPDIARNAVLSFIEGSLLARDMPDEWQSGLLFALNLPQIKRPEPQPANGPCSRRRFTAERKK